MIVRKLAPLLGLAVLLALLSSCALVEKRVARRSGPADAVQRQPGVADAPRPFSLERAVVAVSPKQALVAPDEPSPDVPSEQEPPIQQASFDDDSEPPKLLQLPPAPVAEVTESVAIAKTTSAVQSLTIDQLLQMASENNPTLRQAQAIVNKAHGVRAQVGLYPNPTIAYSGMEMGNEHTSGLQEAFLSQTIVTGNKLQLNQEIVDQNIETLSWNAEIQRLRVETDVRSQFHAVLGAQERVQLARELLKIAEDGADAARELHDAELGTRPDLLQAEIQAHQVGMVLENAEVDLGSSWNRLATLVGQPDLPPAPLAGSLEGKRSDRDFDASYQQLLNSSPEVQAAYARVNLAHARLRRQCAQPTPNLETQFSVGRDNSTGDNYASVEIGIPWPLFNRNEGNIAAATAETHRADQDARRIELQLRDRLDQVYRSYNRARAQVERYETHILPKAREGLEMTEEGYKKGELDFLRALTARRSHFEINLAHVDALVRLRQSEIMISGMLLTGALEEVPDFEGGDDSRSQSLSGQ
ncbi:MAG: transporter [Planctomycetaceae bacterium]|nr:transporter [Planctomycetaceae bacterium]